MMDESVRLHEYQQQLEKETDGKIAFFGKSVHETITTCLTNSMAMKADKLRSDFKVPEKRCVYTLFLPTFRLLTFLSYSYWYIKLQALAAIRDWEGLDAFAKSRRSPIGYEPFVRHLLEKGHPNEAVKYVPRCDSHKRADLYVECGEWKMAAKECKDRNDRAKLECVLHPRVHRTYADVLISSENSRNDVPIVQ